MKDIAVIISPNYKDYAKKYLADCFLSIQNQDVIDRSEIFLIDNETTEESFALLQELAPGCKIIRNQDNAGFAKGNNVAIRAALEQGFKYIVLLNMDTVSEPTAIGELVKAVEADDKIGAVQARLMLYQDKTKVNSLGNATHFLGFGFCEGYGEEYKNHPSSEYRQESIIKNQEIFYPSGAAVLFRAEVLKNIGLFDEEFWMYAEDQDLGWRVWLSGFKCVLASEAIVYHKYEFSRSIQKYYWMDRNRILVILKNYKLATLLLIAPALLVMEVGMLYFSVMNKSLKQKIEVYQYFLKLSTWKYIFRARRTTQAGRLVGDRVIVPHIASVIEYQEIASPALIIANKVFTIYWQLVSRLIVW